MSKESVAIGAAGLAGAVSRERREALIAVCALVVLGLTALTWFRGDAYAVAGYDFATSLRPLDDLTRAFYLWDERLYAGSPNLLAIGTIPYFLLQYVLQTLMGSLWRGQMVFFTLLFLAPGLSMYFFARTIFAQARDRGAMALLAALFYMLNTFVVVKWNRGELITLFGYGMLPLYLGLFEKILTDGPGPARLALFILAMFFYPVTLGHAADFVITTGIFCAFAAWRVAFGGEPGGSLSKRAGAAAAAALAVVLTGAWWIAPLAASILSSFPAGGAGGVAGAGGAGGIASFALADLGLVRYYSSWAGLLNVMKMWFFPMYSTDFEFTTQFYRPGTLLFPIIGFSALLFRRNRYVLFFAALAAAGLWLSKGSHEPLSGLYEWMYQNVPFFFIFRAPSRYFPVIYVFSLTVLTGYSVVSASAAIKRRLPASKVLYRMPVGFVMALVFFHSWPVFSRDVIFRNVTDDVLHPSVFMDLPPYYERLGGWLSAKEKERYFRVHSFTNQAYLNYTWGYSSTDISPKVLEVPQTVKFSQELLFGVPGFHTMMDYFDRSFWDWDFAGTGEVLGLLSVRYITSIDDVIRRYLPHTNYPEILDGVLPRLPGITPAAGFGPAIVYENEKALPHIYTAGRGKVVYGGLASLRTLAGAGYLARPVLVFAGGDSGYGPGDMPPGSMDEVVYADTNVYDAIVDSAPREYRFSPGPGRTEFLVETPGVSLVWSLKGSDPSGRARIEGLDARRTPAGAETPEGLRWEFLGSWDTAVQGQYISVEEGGTGELVVLPEEEWEAAAGGVLKAEGPERPWPVTRLLRAREGGPPGGFAFRSTGGLHLIDVTPQPTFRKKEEALYRKDFTEDPDLGDWIFEADTLVAADGGVTIAPRKGKDGMHAGRMLNEQPPAPAGTPPGVDIEEYPYLLVKAGSKPEGYFDADAVLRLDFNGDGVVDSEMRAPLIRDGEDVGPLDLTTLLKRQYGYPGRRAYRAVSVTLDVSRASGAGRPEGPGGERRPSFTIESMRLVRYVPERVEPTAGGVYGLVLDGSPLRSGADGPVGGAVEVARGRHTLGVWRAGKDGPGDFVIRIAPAAPLPATADPPPEVAGYVKVSPARYTVRVRGQKGPFWLVFNEGFNPGWRAYARPAPEGAGGGGNGGKRGEGGGGGGGVGGGKGRGGKGDGKELVGHYLVNGYANAWWVDGIGAAPGGALDISIEYTPQRTFRAGKIISILSAAFMLAGLPVGALVLKRFCPRGRTR